MHRSKSKLELDQIQQILSDAGYQTWACHRTRPQLIGMLTILVNQVAAATSRSPQLVHDVIALQYRCTLKGARFAPHRVKAIWAWKPVDVDGAPDRSVVDLEPDRCPCCGAPLEPLDPAEGSLDPAEVPTIGRR